MAVWRAKLVDADVQGGVADAIIRAGYDSEELFCGAFVDQAAFEGWMAKFQAKLPDAALTGLAADEWKTHPVAARLRIFWKSAAALATRSAETALALLTPNSGAKLSPSDRERMRRQLEKDYSSVHVTAELCYLNTIQQQKADQLWEWLPWRRILSEEQLLEVKARRSRTGSDSQPDEWDLDIAGAALRVQHLLETRAHAFAMIGVALSCACSGAGVVGGDAGATGQDALRLHDGGGIHSDADWFYPRAADSLKQLRRLWLQRIEQWGLEQRLVSAIASGARNPLLSDGEIQQLRFDVVSFLREQGIERSERVVPGQPLALELWDGLFTVTQDVDAELPRLLEHGVSTGVVNTIPPSGVWREVEVAERPDLELLVHDAPWGSGRIAALQNGQLGLVHKDGAPPRLVGDSTVSNANLLCRVSEKIELPALEDVAQLVSRRPNEDWTAFVLDVSKAHKRVKVRHSEQGLSLFTVIDESGRTHWLVYKTCHFGCAWAAFWWARVAAGLIRLTRVLIAIISHFLSIYVDDSLSLLPSSSAKVLACLQILLACALGVPLSWHKLYLGKQVRWIGWLFNLGGKLCATLPEDKSVRLVAALSAVARVGSRHSRMAIWFRMLLKPVLRFLPLDRAQLAEVLELLDSRARLLQRAQLCDAQAGWKLLECGGQIVWNSWFQDCEFKNGRVWVKFGDFDASCVQATKEESSVALFFLRIVQATSPVHLVEKEGPCVVAAADAFAERDVAGLGGWWLPPGCALSLANVKYFSCYIRRVDLPTWFLHDDDGKQVQSLQSCICALEALAQLVLLDARLRDGQSRASLGR
ncbi:Ubr3, partial [Symbiodinium pilosum]